MDKKTTLTALINFGLSEHEAKIYLAALSSGPAGVAQIARAAGIKRTTAYSVIESLKNDGLMAVEIKGFKKKFLAEDPERLENILENRRSLLKKIMPEFNALYNLKGGESVVKCYEGLKGIKFVYESLLRDIKPHDNYLIISNSEKWFSLDQQYFSDFTKRRAKLNINIRLLLQNTATARAHKKLEKNFNEKIKLLPHGTSLHTNMVITPQKLVIHQVIQPIMAIVIENQSIIKTNQELFEIMWATC